MRPGEESDFIDIRPRIKGEYLIHVQIQNGYFSFPAWGIKLHVPFFITMILEARESFFVIMISFSRRNCRGMCVCVCVCLSLALLFFLSSPPTFLYPKATTRIFRLHLPKAARGWSEGVRRHRLDGTRGHILGISSSTKLFARLGFPEQEEIGGYILLIRFSVPVTEMRAGSPAARHRPRPWIIASDRDD